MKIVQVAVSMTPDGAGNVIKTIIAVGDDGRAYELAGISNKWRPLPPLPEEKA